MPAGVSRVLGHAYSTIPFGPRTSIIPRSFERQSGRGLPEHPVFSALKFL